VIYYPLISRKQCLGTGIEIDEKEILPVHRQGLDRFARGHQLGVDRLFGQRFDYVILNESLQQVLDPQKTILAALRVGKKVVVGSRTSAI